MSTSDRGPAYYPAAPFQACRVVSGLSCTIVAGILIYFCMQLKNDGFKLPWTFLIVLAAAIFNLIALLLTALISCCGSRSPLINLLINLPIFLLWTVAFSVLCYNILGLLAHSCSISVWAADEGVSVCHTYKTLFSVVVFAVLTQLVLVSLDIRARRQQVKDGKYDKMNATTDLKVNPTSGTNGLPSPGQLDQREDNAGWRPGTYTNDKNGITSEQYELQPQNHHRDDLSSYHSQSPQYAQSGYGSSYSSDMRHGTPEYIGSPYSHGSQYQAHDHSSLHERTTTNQYAYGHPPQPTAYNSPGYGYHNDRGY